jgi:hypothetical protein
MRPKKEIVALVFSLLPIGPMWGGVAEAIDVVYSTTSPVVDGIIAPGEYSDANSVSIPIDHPGMLSCDCDVYFKHDGETLFVAFDVRSCNRDMTDEHYASIFEVTVDLENDKVGRPDADDHRFSMSVNLGQSEDVGDNSLLEPWWNSISPTGWTAEDHVTTSEWTAEYALSFDKLTITPSVAKTIGIAFVIKYGAGVSGDDEYPSGAQDVEPDTWDEASSSDAWFSPAVPTLTAPGIVAASVLLVGCALVFLMRRRRQESA